MPAACVVVAFVNRYGMQLIMRLCHLYFPLYGGKQWNTAQQQCSPGTRLFPTIKCIWALPFKWQWLQRDARPVARVFEVCYASGCNMRV
jgi:hypothetical protein